MRCCDASFNTYSLYLAPQFFSRNYYLHLISANIYVSAPDISINDIAFVSWRILCVDLSRFSRQFGKIVPRGRAQATSQPFAPAIIVTGVTIRGRRVLARERHARVHSSAFTDHAMRTSARSERCVSTMAHDS